MQSFSSDLLWQGNPIYITTPSKHKPFFQIKENLQNKPNKMGFDIPENLA
jgi:hypothetical protein